LYSFDWILFILNKEAYIYLYGDDVSVFISQLSKITYLMDNSIPFIYASILSVTHIRSLFVSLMSEFGC